MSDESSKRPDEDIDIESLVRALKRYSAAVRDDHRLTGASVRTATVESRLCGSHLTLDAEIRDGRIERIGYSVRACSLGQAATAIVVRQAIGFDCAELAHVRRELEAILRGEVVVPAWPELTIFTHAVNIPTRHDSARLPFVALERIFEASAQS